jgi:ankyrin repeat protein
MENVEFTNILIDEGADVNQMDDLGNSPLSIASFFGYTDIAKLLLENKAIISAAEMDRAYKGWDGYIQTEILDLFRKFGWYNLFLDDIRPPIPGFSIARTMEDAVSIIENNRVHILSLDHDLGEDEEGNLRKNGYDLVKYICDKRIRAANRIFLHTSNIVGRENMYQTLLAARRRGFIDSDIEIYHYPYSPNRYTGE